MIVKQIPTKSCCGAKAIVLELEKSISKSDVNLFKNAGFTIAPNFLNVGVAYFNKGNFTISGMFGSTRLASKCSGPTCDKLLNEFLEILNKL